MTRAVARRPRRRSRSPPAWRCAWPGSTRARCTTTRRTRRSSSARCSNAASTATTPTITTVPTLYYLTLPAAWLRGQHTLASLDERTLRGVTVVVRRGDDPAAAVAVGRRSARTAVAASALLMALSPAMVFYSRMFIQESLFACFTLAFVIALGRAVTGRADSLARRPARASRRASRSRRRRPRSSCCPRRSSRARSRGGRSDRRARRAIGDRRGDRQALARGLATAAVDRRAVLLVVLHGAGGLLEPFRGAGTYVDRGIEPASHAHPWHYYLGLLAYFVVRRTAGGARGWSSLLAIAGAVSAWRRRRIAASRNAPSGRAISPANVAIAAAIFSALPYKTPWNVLPFYAGAIVVAGHRVLAARPRGAVAPLARARWQPVS